MPFGPDGIRAIFSEVDYLDTWKAFEAIQKKGLAKSIGVSNFNKRQLERLLQNSSVVPVTNQVRLLKKKLPSQILDEEHLSVLFPIFCLLGRITYFYL